jgi:hypothetical protein
MLSSTFTSSKWFVSLSVSQQMFYDLSFGFMCANVLLIFMCANALLISFKFICSASKYRVQ